MDNINVMKYWLNSAERDYDTMKVMYENKKKYKEYINGDNQ